MAASRLLDFGDHFVPGLAVNQRAQRRTSHSFTAHQQHADWLRLSVIQWQVLSHRSDTWYIKTRAKDVPGEKARNITDFFEKVTVALVTIASSSALRQTEVCLAVNKWTESWSDQRSVIIVPSASANRYGRSCVATDPARLARFSPATAISCSPSCRSGSARRGAESSSNRSAAR